MSISEKIEMKCPRCEALQVVTAWKLLDVKLDPAAKDALFAWEINIFSCDKCDFRAQMPVSLLYLDTDREFRIRYYPMDALGNEEFYKSFKKNGSPVETHEDAISSPEHSQLPHIVFDMAEMMRYIVFREVAFEKGKN